ncbi:MAG: hypothetical protein Q7W55_11815 [Pseudohongiella sp.]|nr:hypothetical protein [Pseudohongiella sp.]MDP2127486.1 hypothetical protein [Pseudohongiella sp.]
MSRSSRKQAQKTSRKLKATSFMPMCVTCGLFLGFGLGAMLNSVLLVTALGLLLGTSAGYFIDSRNGIAYTRRKT